MPAPNIVPVTMDAVGWMQLIGLGGVMGAVGQVIRMIVGLKKLNDAASNSTTSMTAMVEPSRLFVSIVIGAVAGALAAIGLAGDLSHVSTQQLLALAAAGYAGCDFIEGFMSRVASAPGAPAGQPAVGTQTGAAPAAVSDGSVG